MATGGEKLTPPKAIISCFLREKGNLYAVVCKHFTAFEQSKFQVEKLESTFAKRIKTKTKEETPTYNDFDIDIVKVKGKRNRKKCKSVFRDVRGNIKKGRVFMGDVNKIDQVFACCKTKSSDDTPRTGRVLPQSEIKGTIAENYNMGTHFIVEGESFADPGDSGRLVAYENTKSEDGFLDLIGIIVHKPDNQTSDNLTVCLKLSEGIKYLNGKYGLQLTLCVDEDHRNDERVFVEPGDTISYKV